MRNTTAIALLLACSCMVSGCFIFNLFKAIAQDIEDGKVSKEYTPENEYYIGRGVSAAIVDLYPASDMSQPTTQNQIAYLSQMGGYIYQASGEIDRNNLGDHVGRDDDEWERLNRFALFKDVHVGILETKEVMAYATPGGFIWISRGTIAMCKNEEELAAVIAHELGHVAMNHGMDAYRKATEGNILDSNTFGVVKSKMPGKTGQNFANLVGGFIDNLVKNGYSKDQEFEADNFGTRALAAAGYHPRAMVDMLKNMEAYEKAHPSDEGAFSKNHPDTEDRIELVEKLLKDPKAKIKVPGSDPGKAARDARFKSVFGR